jgi:NADPH:quinone reductase-like Zn-dependent oxidoreductase
MSRAQLLARTSGLRVKVPVAKPGAESFAELAALVEAGSVRAVVERTFTLDDAAEAIRRLEVEHARAKVVVRVG